MMNKNVYPLLLSILLLVSLVACNNDDIKFVAYEPQVVVEGRIEADQYASVLLSTSIPYIGLVDIDELLHYAIKHAKVTISDGTNSEILFLKTNYDKIPPYEYVTREMKGEAGKTYHLTIELEDQTIEAETFIPEPVEIENIWFKKKNDSDTTGYIHIEFVNSSQFDYQISTKDATQDTFVPCLYGNIDKTLYPSNQMVSMQINKGPIIYPETDFKTTFDANKDTWVKLSTQTKASYEFWTSYQNEIINSQNPIFPSVNKLKSNVIGGIGIWAGYGSTIRMVKAVKAEKNNYL